MKNLLSKSIVFVLILFLSSPGHGYAQSMSLNERIQFSTQSEEHNRTVTIKRQELTLESAIKKIEQLTNLTFIYSRDNIDLLKPLILQATQTPIGELMDDLCSQLGITYQFRSDKIILSSKHKETPPLTAFTVSGQVLDGDSGLPLPGVNIRIKDTSQGTTTDRDGRFLIDELSEGNQLVFSFIGYSSKTVTVEEANEITVRLYPKASELSEVVVTALNIDRERSRLGYSIQSVKGEELNNSSESNIVNALSGKASGINVTSASGNIGSSSRIVIRGESSISGNNQPLFVIDGTPVDNSNIKSGTGSGFRPSPSGSRSAIDFGNAISDLNPADIESISVLKGPNAAALYGSRAANGVIQIKTKTGQGIEGFTVTANSSVAFQRPSILPDYQNEYGQGAGDYFEYVDGANGVHDGTDSSFGPPLDEGLEFVQFNSGGEPAPWVSYPDNVKNFFETGTKVSNNIAIAGGSGGVDYKLSMTNVNEKGMVPNTDLGRNNISLNAGARLSDNFNVRTSVNYIKTNSGNRMGGGYDDQNVMKQFMWFGRQVDIPALENQYKQYGNDMNWNTSWNSNPYFMLYENTNSLDRDRLIGNVALTYNFSEQLSLSLRAGNDFYNDVRSLRRAYDDFEFPKGAFTEDAYKISEQNYDFLLEGDQSLNEDFSVNYSAGGNWLKKTMRQNKVQANQLAVPGVYNVGNAKGIPSARNRYEEKQVYSLYGLTEVRFRDYLFLEVTGRNDWSSTLPLHNNSYFYPSISLSGVLTEMFDTEGTILDYLKFRGSYAQVGSDTDPYQISSVYNSAVSNWGSMTTVSEANTIPNVDLKPQLTNSYEAGADIRLFQGRLGVDFTWYHTLTENQIISSSISNTSGYSQRYFNAGEIQNKGIELTTYLKPMAQASPIQWEVEVNYARNRNEVVELAEGIDRIQLQGNHLFGLDVVAVEGEPYGAFYGRGMQRNDDGEVIFGSNGLPELTETGEIQGNYQPNWTGSISNSITFRNITVTTLIDGSFGGQIYSGTNVVGRRAGVLASTLPGREEGIIGDGVVENPDGTYSTNTTRVDAKSWYSGYYAYDNTEVSIFDSNYIKLREARLAYNLPNSLLEHIPVSSINLSMVGRNLLLLHNSVPNIDPETAIASDLPQGLEVAQVPSPRSISFNVSVSF